MNKKKVSVPVVALYVLSVVFLMIGAFSVWFTYDYITNAVTSGFVISDNLPTVFNYYFTQCGPNFVYAILLYSAGVIISRLDRVEAVTTTVQEVEEVVVSEEPQATSGAVVEEA